MSKKENNKKTKSESDSIFEDWEESFFSSQPSDVPSKVSVPSTSTQSGDSNNDQQVDAGRIHNSEEESSEDFGYDGEVGDLEMALDDGSDATDVFNRSEYDALLEEWDAQEDVSDALSDDSEEESPEIELVAKFRNKKTTDSSPDPAVMDDLLQEFAEDLGEPLPESEMTQDPEQSSTSANTLPLFAETQIEDDILEFGDLDFSTDPFVEDDMAGRGQSIDDDFESDDLLAALEQLDGTDNANQPLDFQQDDHSLLEMSFDDVERDSTDIIALEHDQSGEASLDIDDTWDGLVDHEQLSYVPSSDVSHYTKLRMLFLQESKLLSNKQDQQYLWAECARISADALRDDASALDLYAQANDHGGVLRNVDLKRYADVAAHSGQTRLYLDVLQQWALEREGELAAEAWGDIAIFLQKRFGNSETATEAIGKALEADPSDWLNWQFLCQLQEGTGDWEGLISSLQQVEHLSSGPLATSYLYQQGVVALQYNNDTEQGIEILKQVLERGTHFKAARELLKVGVQLDDSEIIHIACTHIWNNLQSKRDKLLWALRLYDLTHGAYGQDKLLESIDIDDSIESFWLYLALLENGDVDERKRVLLAATEQEREDLALVWFHLSLLFEQEDDERAGEALLKTVELDPFAIIAVDDYVEHLIAKEAFEECVDWLNNLYELVQPEAPEVALAYLAQAAFIADAYLNDPIRAANMLSHAAAEESELSYLAETLYLRGEHWEALIAFYKKRANQATDPADGAHWMIQAGIIAETRLNQVEQAEELYALARQKSEVSKIGITDVLRLRIRSGDWQEVVDIIAEQAHNAIDPAGMYFMAANVSHCLLQNKEQTIGNLEKCLEYAPNHLAALLLYRRISDGSKRVWANQQLLTYLSHESICGWLQWENSNQPEFDIASVAFTGRNVFFLERMFVLLLSDMDMPKDNFQGVHPLVDTLLLSKANHQEAEKLATTLSTVGLGDILFFESLGMQTQVSSMVQSFSPVNSIEKVWLAEFYESKGLLEQAEQLWLELFGTVDEDQSGDTPATVQIQAALALDKVLRHLPERHLLLAKVHSRLAEWLEDDSPVNYFSLLAAQLFSSLGNVSEATRLYKVRFNTRPILGKVFMGLKRLFLQTHNVDEMQSLLSQLDSLELVDFAEIMEEFREYGKAADAYAKMLDLSKHLSAAQVLPYYSRMERCYEKSGNWSSVLSTLEAQRNLVVSMEFQHFLNSKIQWVLVEHLAESDIALETYERMLENDPNNRSVLQALAKISIQHDQIPKAIQYLNILAENPTDPADAIQIMETLVSAYQAQGNITKEIEILKDIIDIDAGNLDALDQLADCLQQQGQWQELFTLLQRRSLLSEDHDKVACHTRIARIAEERLLDLNLAIKEWSKVYELMGPEEETLRHLIKLSKSQFDTPSFLHYADELVGLLEGDAKAQLCMEVADTYINELLEESKAIPYLEVALLEEDTFARAASLLEAQYQIMGEWQKLLDLLLHKESKSSNPEERVSILLNAAEIAEVSLQQFEQAEEIFQYIGQLDPSNPVALKRKANRLYSEEAWEELLALYAEYETVFSDTSRNIVDMRLRQAEAAEALKDWDVVVSSLREVLGIVPTHLMSLQMMSEALRQANQISEAFEVDKRLLDALIEQGNKDEMTQVSLRLGEASLQLEQWSQALDYFKRARINAPKDSRSLKGIIECSWQKGEYSLVAQLCSTLVKNATTEADVVLGYLWRGFTLGSKLQRQELAEQHYWKVLQYEQQHPVALIYVAAIAMQKNKWTSVMGHLTQAWDALQTNKDISNRDELLRIAGLGRLIAAKHQQTDEATEVVVHTKGWFESFELEVPQDILSAFTEAVSQRLFDV